MSSLKDWGAPTRAELGQKRCFCQRRRRDWLTVSPVWLMCDDISGRSSAQVALGARGKADWRAGYRAAARQRCCFDRPAWPLRFAITWSQPLGSKVGANGRFGRQSHYASGWRQQQWRWSGCFRAALMATVGLSCCVFIVILMSVSSVWIHSRRRFHTRLARSGRTFTLCRGFIRYRRKK